MNKLSTFALSLAVALAIPASAMAWQSDRRFDVSIETRDRSVDVGTWRFELAEMDEDGGELDLDDAELCTYFVSWTNAAELSSRTNLVLSQIATVSNSDCEENDEEGLTSILFLNEDEIENRGFNRFQQRRDVEALILGQDEDGDMHGVIQFEDGGVYSIVAE